MCRCIVQPGSAKLTSAKWTRKVLGLEALDLTSHPTGDGDGDIGNRIAQECGHVESAWKLERKLDLKIKSECQYMKPLTFT